MALLIGARGAASRTIDRCWMRAIMALLIAVAYGAGAAENKPTESTVKAAYLYKFASFVQWPDDAFASTSDTLQICIVGIDSIASLATEAAAGQTVGARSISVRPMTRPPAPDTLCHVLFVERGAEGAAAALQEARGRPILTVTEAADTRVQGVINFVLDGNRVRFEIDLEAASQNGLVISSKLLSLAVKVRPVP